MSFRIEILSFIYYLQVAGSHHVFQKKNYYLLYITNKLQDPIMFFRIQIL